MQMTTPQQPFASMTAQAPSFTPSASAPFMPLPQGQQPQFTYQVNEFVPSIPDSHDNVFQRSSKETQRQRGAQGVPYQFNPHTCYPMALPMLHSMQAGYQKSEFCRNWIESAKCRFEDKCRYAHAQEELTPMAVLLYGDKFKANNCRTFYKTSTCNFGEKCMFRHEHRAMFQLHRHYYTPHLYALESFFSCSKDQTRFLEEYESVPETLPIFKEIHAQFEPSEDDSSEVTASDISETAQDN